LNSLVAILIPTMNRVAYLKRQLDYYSSLESKHPIYVGDSSNYEISQEIQKVINGYKNLKIVYNYLPNMNPREVNNFLSINSTERYVAFCGDDDFLVPSGLDACARFLDADSSYVSAQGASLIFELEEECICRGRIGGISNYWGQPQEIAFSSADRLLNFSRKYWVPLFSVTRREIFIKASSHDKLKDFKWDSELINSFDLVALGRSMYIDCAYMLRETHATRIQQKNFYDWIITPEFISGAEYFMERIKNRMIIDVDSEIMSEKISKEILKNYLRQCSTSSSEKSTKSIWLSIQKFKAFIKNLFFKIANIYPGGRFIVVKNKKISRKYFNEFNLIFKVVQMRDV